MQEVLSKVQLPEFTPPATLELLVEGFGHVNFGVQMENDRKGLYGSVTYNDVELEGWDV